MSAIAVPYRQMALNNAWANATVYSALADIGADALAAARPGFFGSLKATLNHILKVDEYYVDALEQGGIGRSVFYTPEHETVADLAAAQAAIDKRLTAFCASLTPEILAETRQTERKDGVVDEEVSALLLHLFQHQIHHRGQAHVQIGEAGIAPPQLDEFHLDFERASTAEAYVR
ncbi:MAG: DinB family protein [Rhodobacteraceae bacterium]|nr:DinB family protein [Paracoccaceae bacterium]